MLSFDLYFILLAILCYLAGSIPFGYLIVQIFHSKDISKEGSGNVGTLNAYEVSQSKLIAVLVLILDFLKGALTVYVLIYVLNLNALTVLMLSCFIIAGHNYSIWLKFKGGRGLASAAGIFLVINYAMLITWCVIWILFYPVKKDVLIANSVATLSMPVFAILLRKLYLTAFPVQLIDVSLTYFLIFMVIILALILIKHKAVFSKLLPVAAKDLNKL